MFLLISPSSILFSFTDPVPSLPLRPIRILSKINQQPPKREQQHRRSTHSDKINIPPCKIRILISRDRLTNSQWRSRSTTTSFISSFLDWCLYISPLLVSLASKRLIKTYLNSRFRPYIPCPFTFPSGIHCENHCCCS